MKNEKLKIKNVKWNLRPADEFINAFGEKRRENKKIEQQL
jgi:hypothetical protein